MSNRKRRPFFVLVHAFIISDEASPHQYNEIQRIKREEEFVEIFDNPHDIHPATPEDRKILVCGGLRNVCVADQLRKLKTAGYNAKIYDKATID